MIRAYCPQCKNEFSKNMRFCYNCGKKLNDIINNKCELYSIGMYALEIEDYISAAFWFTEASKHQYGEAQFQLGVLYENGFGVKINIKNAEYCYKKAAENGVITASIELERLLSKKNISILEEDYTYEYDEASDLSFFDVDKLSAKHSIDISDGAVIQQEFSNHSKAKTHDEIFDEEKEHLRNTIDEIDEYIANSEANAILPNLSNIVNKESRSDYLLEREKYDKTKIEIAEIEKLKEEPYFGRMNLKCSTTDEVDDMYVGKEPIVINGRQIVYSCWSPIGNKIYDSISTEYEYNEYKYTLQFRRKFNITSGNLVDCTEDYNINSDAIYKGISDPFLKKVLEQKKNVKHLTDIIKTIQGNQNELIRKPITENFIVQGCAGSGKTMILLHRLASLKYLNPTWDLERVKIISPSESFNFHINHLWRDLKIDDIKIFCLEKYYLEILKKYECQKYNNVNISSDEECRDQDLVDYIYSDAVIRKLSDIINNTGYKERLKKQADKNYYESDVYKRYKIKEQQYNENEMMKSPEKRWRTKGPTPPKKHIIAADIYDIEFDGIINNISFENKKVYKFELYLQLLLNFMCYGNFTLGDSHLFIDEGHNISVNEYLLMNNINSSVAFNIFGDTKQLLLKGRGIHSWDEQLSVLGNINIYFLKENYRNTVEINEYCNELFGFDNVSLGLDGVPVRNIDLPELTHIIKQIDPSSQRIAIISNRENSFVLKNLLKDISYLSYSKIEDGFISLLTVDETKGLEFDIVYVLPDGMSDNEKYLSYTRALSQLVLLSNE